MNGCLPNFFMIRLSYRLYLLIPIRQPTKIIGNTEAASRPFCIFSLDFVQIPTSDGPNVPPMSPAKASIANMAVPPVGMRFDVMLMEPGHMIPTANPLIMQPIKLICGIGDRDAVR